MQSGLTNAGAEPLCRDIEVAPLTQPLRRRLVSLWRSLADFMGAVRSSQAMVSALSTTAWAAWHSRLRALFLCLRLRRFH